MTVSKINPRSSQSWDTALTAYKKLLYSSLRGIHLRSSGHAGKAAKNLREETYAALKIATGLDTIPLGVYRQFEDWAEEKIGFKALQAKWHKIAKRLMQKKMCMVTCCQILRKPSYCKNIDDCFGASISQRKNLIIIYRPGGYAGSFIWVAKCRKYAIV